MAAGMSESSGTINHDKIRCQGQLGRTDYPGKAAHVVIDFADHLGPALGRETPELLLDISEREILNAILPDLP